MKEGRTGLSGAPLQELSSLAPSLPLFASMERATHGSGIVYPFTESCRIAFTD